MAGGTDDTQTGDIRDWRSIVTLIVFVITNIIVLFPFHIPVPAPLAVRNGFLDLLWKCRIIEARHEDAKPWRFHMNFSTAPLIADLFLLAILAIGRTEVYNGTVGADHIYPLEIMGFFLTLAYIAISIDASGLIRWLAFKVLQKGGKNGRLLFFYLYSFFFGLTAFVGNDPIVLSGTAFLAYLTRVSANIVRPTAWIFMQFSMANVGSAILVSSNPTNLVLAGAFEITFIVYTANMIVPVVATAIILFPFLLFVIFPDKSLVPHKIELHDLPEDRKNRAPVNPNIPNARAGKAEEDANDEEGRLLSLEEIMNPFLDKKGAFVGAGIMALTLIAILTLNAVGSSKGKEWPVIYVTAPAAALMLAWDLFYGWTHRRATLETVRKLEAEVAEARARQAELDEQEADVADDREKFGQESHDAGADGRRNETPNKDAEADSKNDEKVVTSTSAASSPPSPDLVPENASSDAGEKGPGKSLEPPRSPATLQSIFADLYRRSQINFPTATTVFSHLPFALVPFGLCMFVLVQALVTKGWVEVFAHGWDHWVRATGPVGAIGGMGFLGVVLCNFAGTNIGTTILLCRVIQAWLTLRADDPVDMRTFWATVYSLAIGVNYGAFSSALSASLAGLLWRDILARKHIKVTGREFARVNLPIITVTMVVGCAVLVGQVWITRSATELYTG